ncbi:unnamed protein product [Moneuplotes crassus]|uniref:Uncharacterized protein n=1 Tax=Euplotes crassus TaxID=5936 RepID=A0AAD1Y6G7_EUPCR|nr:unnamed protein product [Moneuplotes crassus]
MSQKSRDNRDSLEREVYMDSLILVSPKLNSYKSSFLKIDGCSQAKGSNLAIQTLKDKSYNDDCYSKDAHILNESTMDRESTLYLGRESTTIATSIKEEVSKLRNSSKGNSKAQLYTPRLKMPFSSIKPITPVLRKKINLKTASTTISKVSRNKLSSECKSLKCASGLSQKAKTLKRTVTDITRKRNTITSLKPAKTISKNSTRKTTSNLIKGKKKSPLAAKSKQAKINSNSRKAIKEIEKKEMPFKRAKTFKLPQPDLSMCKTPKNKAQRNRNCRNSITAISNKFKPSLGNLLTPVRKSSRNKSTSGNVTPKQNCATNIPLADRNTTLKKSPKRQNLLMKKGMCASEKTKKAQKKTVLQEYKDASLSTKKEPFSKPIPYIEKVKKECLKEKDDLKQPSNKIGRVELIKKKNLKRKEKIKCSKTIHPEIKMNLGTKFEQQAMETEKKELGTYKPMYLKYNQNEVSRELFYPLNSIKEVIGEDTNTTGKSSGKVVQFMNTDQVNNELAHSLSEVSTPQECTEIIEPYEQGPHQKDTLDEIKIFMNNIEQFDENTMPNEKKRDSYSPAFLELLNSEVIEDSPKNKNSDKRSEQCHYNEKSQELSWNKITNNLLLNQTFSDYSHESSDNILTSIDDFLKANRKEKPATAPKRKREVSKEKPLHKILSTKEPKKIFSINKEKEIQLLESKFSEPSDIFNLSKSSKGRGHESARQTAEEMSDIFKSDISTLKDFSNLCSSRTTPISLKNKIKAKKCSGVVNQTECEISCNSLRLNKDSDVHPKSELDLRVCRRAARKQGELPSTDSIHFLGEYIN